MKKIISIVAIISLSLSTLAGCGGGTSKASSAPSASSAASTSGKKITIEGSTSVTPLMEKLTEEYKKTNNIEISIQGNGSSAGIKAAAEGRSMIGMSSRELKAEEKTGLVENVIALDGIAVIIHKNNPLADLTVDQISKVFKGEIKNWKDLGGSDKPIVVVSREEGSGTRGAFEELMKLEEKSGDKTISLLVQNASIADSNGSVKASVASKENAIGYISLGSVDDTVNKLKVDGVEASVQTIKDKTYKVSRPFLVVTKGQPEDEVKSLIDFIHSAAGKEIIAKSYITVD